MSFEFWSTFAAIGTFLVIGASALAAVVQLRHLRASNQLTGLLTVLARVEDPNFNAWVDDAKRAIEGKIQDPDFRRPIVDGTFERKGNAWLNLANSYEWVGSLVKNRLIPEGAFMDIYAYRVVQAWTLLGEVTVLRRRELGPSLWENFEYIAVRAQEWVERHPDGTYPTNVKRWDLVDSWLAVDGVAAHS